MSPTTNYSVTDGSIAAHAARLDSTHQAMNSALTQFSASLSSLPAVWRGASFTSFSEVQTRWQNATTELNRALADIKDRVSTSATLYQAGETEQASALRHVGQSADWTAGSFRG